MKESPEILKRKGEIIAKYNLSGKIKNKLCKRKWTNQELDWLEKNLKKP